MSEKVFFLDVATEEGKSPSALSSFVHALSERQTDVIQTSSWTRLEAVVGESLSASLIRGGEHYALMSGA